MKAYPLNPRKVLFFSSSNHAKSPPSLFDFVAITYDHVTPVFCIDYQSIQLAPEIKMADGLIENKPKCSAGIIIIGDEILKGHTKDTNSHFLLRKLWSLGVKVGKVSVISDDVDEIAHEVQKFSSLFSFVITTGGIGPTHDDVTMAGIAKAFEEELVLNEELVHLISGAFDLNSQNKVNLSSSHLKMARVPSSLKLSYGKDQSGKQSNFPLISAHNVYIFPGVPQYLEQEFGLLENHLLISNSDRRFFLRKIYLSAEETSIASILHEVDEKFKGIVHLGSYPDCCSHDFKVKLSLESDNLSHLKEAWDYLLHRLPKDIIVKAEVDDCDLTIPDSKYYSRLPITQTFKGN